MVEATFAPETKRLGKTVFVRYLGDLRDLRIRRAVALALPRTSSAKLSRTRVNSLCLGGAYADERGLVSA